MTQWLKDGQCMDIDDPIAQEVQTLLLSLVDVINGHEPGIGANAIIALAATLIINGYDNPLEIGKEFGKSIINSIKANLKDGMKKNQSFNT